MLTAEENKLRFREGLQEIFNARSTAAAERFLAPDLVAHHPLESGPISGIESFKELLESLFAAVPHWQLTIEDLVGDGDLVGARLTSSGTQSAPLAGYPASGKEFATREIWLCRFSDGKATELWLAPDMFDLLRQLELVPDGPPPKPVLRIMRVVDRLAPKKEGTEAPEPPDGDARAVPARFRTVEGLKAQVRDALECLNARDMDGAERYFTPDLVVHHPTEREPILRMTGFRRLIETAVTGFPNWHLGIEDLAAEGDVVVAHLMSTGTHTGDFVGFPPSGRNFAVREMMAFRFVGDQAAEAWIIPDLNRQMQQLGLMPPGPPPKPMLVMMRWMQRRKEGKGAPA